MKGKIYGFAQFGYEGSLVEVEADLRRGIPSIDILGLADVAVKESRERVRSAILNSGLEMFPGRILISLSPGDMKKEGAAFDLPVALAMLGKDIDIEEDVFVMGELELNGRVRTARGIEAALQTAKSAGIKYAIVPKGTHKTPGMKMFFAETLQDAYMAINGDIRYEECDEPQENAENGIDFNNAIVEEIANINVPGELKYAMAIAIAGKHNAMLVGAPGCGKTLLAQSMRNIMPLLDREESQVTARIHSVAGILPKDGIVKVPPFRMPHQTASVEGMCGGGPHCLPGEISLAHNGVLFLDEAAEFRSSVLQLLRVPLESRQITLSRAGRSTVFPADFQLIMAANPCPCGNYGSKDKICLCSARSIEMYWKKFSGSLLNRIPIRLDFSQEWDSANYCTDELREIVKKAREMQKKRGVYNQNMTLEQVRDFCPMSEEAKSLYTSVMDENDLSIVRGAGLLRVSRTVADINGHPDILLKDLELAVRYCGIGKDAFDI